MKTKVEKLVVEGVTYVPENEVKLASIDGKKAVLIRTYSAGVHYGYLENKTYEAGICIVTLSNTRRVWYWDGACSLSELALRGTSKPSNCKISVVLPEIELQNVIEIIPITEEALINLNNVYVWEQ